MGKGNEAYKIPPIYSDFEIDHNDAKIGDMVINRVDGTWDRIKSIVTNDLKFETSLLTKHGKEYKIEEVMVVRY